MILVLLDIEKRLRIAGPDDVVGRVGDAIGKILAPLDVAYPDRQHFGAELVEAPGEFRVIGRMRGCGQAKERPAFGANVAIEQNHLVTAFAGPAAVDPILAALAISRIIGPRPVDLRRLAIVLPEPRPHLANKLPLQLGSRREQCVGVGVLRLEQRPNVERQSAGIAQHLAPVLGPDPSVFVDPVHSVRRTPQRARLRARGHGRTGSQIVIDHPTPRFDMGSAPAKPVEGRRNFVRSGAERRSAGLTQFFLAAEAPQRPDGRNRVPLGAGDVVLAVAPHDAVGSSRTLFQREYGR